MNGDTIVDYSSVENVMTSVSNVIPMIDNAKTRIDSINQKLEVVGNVKDIAYFGLAYHSLNGYFKCMGEDLDKLSSYITYVQNYINLVIEATKLEDEAIKKINTTDTMKVDSNG